jgi:molybdopterin/thiamine biosynthesis adenylyltransferase
MTLAGQTRAVKTEFDYDNAFSRNIGWVTASEQQTLRGKRVAIAGLGGVGGAHLLTLTRLGIGAFHIADFDIFDIANFNRQAGAMTSTVGREKSEVLCRMARDINPELQVTVFAKGVNEQNMDAFLDGIDLYVDGLDFFAFSARKAVFHACAQRGVPATTAAPLGMGAAVLNFVPGGMTFEEYFRWDGCSEDQMALRFLIGLAPAMLQLGYLVDRNAVDFHARKGPSTPMACDICAGMAATEALKILLHRGKVLAAPHGVHFDAYRCKMVRTWRPGGNRNPIQRLALAIATRQISRKGQSTGSASEKLS